MIVRRRLLVMLLAAAATTPALAVGPSHEVVQERLYSLDGRLDLSVLAGISMNNKLTDQYGLLFRPAYQLTDAWAVELTGGYVLAAEKRQLTSEIRQQIQTDPELASEFADMSTLQWIAQGAVRWSPIYGKLSLFSEVPLHFGAYVSAGGGFVGTSRRSLVDCTGGSVDQSGYYDATCTAETAVQPSVGLGVGLRFFLSDWAALRVELEDFVFPDSYRLNVGTADERRVNDLSTVLMFMAGASFYF